MSKPLVRGLIIASVVLNVFLIGAIVGGGLWLKKARTGNGFSLAVAGRQLPEADRKAFRRALRQVRIDSRQAILDGQQARQDAANVLQQPDLNSKALSSALERARNADVAVRARLEQAIVDFAASTTAENRKVLADALVRRAERRAAVAPKKSP